jgi:hypothetical protein
MQISTLSGWNQRLALDFPPTRSKWLTLRLAQINSQSGSCQSECCAFCFQRLCVLNWVTDFAGVDRFNFFFQPEHPQKHLRLTRRDNARLFIAKSQRRHPSQLQNSECMLALLFAECAAPRKLHTQVRFFFSCRIQFCLDQQLLALCGKVFLLLRTNKRRAFNKTMPWTQAVFFKWM